MSLVLGLPERLLQYKVYRMRLGQIKMMNARGYIIAEEQVYLLDSAIDDRSKYLQFCAQEYIGTAAYYFSDVFEHPTDQREVTSILCTAKNAEDIIENIIAQAVVAPDMPTQYVDLQVITTDVIGEYFPDSPLTRVEIIPYHMLYIDPVTHMRASGWSSVLDDQRRQDVMDSYRAQKVSFVSIAAMDPLSLQLGARRGDIICVCSNNINSGALTSRILYREVV